MKLKQIGMGNQQSARMGVVELMLHVPAQINSTTGRNNSPLLSGRTRRGGTVKNNFAVIFINAIDKKPIRFNMTFHPPLVAAPYWTLSICYDIMGLEVLYGSGKGLL